MRVRRLAFALPVLASLLASGPASARFSCFNWYSTICDRWQCCTSHCKTCYFYNDSTGEYQGDIQSCDAEVCYDRGI